MHRMPRTLWPSVPLLCSAHDYFSAEQVPIPPWLSGYACILDASVLELV